MLLERAASLFQAQGWQVKVNPCVIGDSGAIHNPDLSLHRDGEKSKAVFVLEELDGPMPLEGRAAMARDMGLDPVFVVGTPSPEVAQWAQRHRRTLLTDADLPGAAPFEQPQHLAPAPAAEPEPQAIAEETGAELLAAPAPRPRALERPLTAFASPSPVAPPASLSLPAPLPPAQGLAPLPRPAPRLGRGVVQMPSEVPDDGDAVLLQGNPRADAPPPRAAKPGRGVVHIPVEVPEDGDAMLLPSRAPPPMAAAQPPQPPAVEPEGGESGAELLPSGRSMVRDPDKVLKHDPSIWDPRARLAQVKQAAKALSFDATGGTTTAPASGWLRGLRKE